MIDNVKIAAILADLQSFDKKLAAGGLTGEDKAKFSKTVAEMAALLAPAVDAVEVPRLVKKPGETKRVNTRAELDAALKDGWVLRLKDEPASGESPASFTAQIAAMSAKDAITAIEAHTDVADLKAAKKAEDRATVKDAIDKRLKELAAV